MLGPSKTVRPGSAWRLLRLSVSVFLVLVRSKGL